MKSKHIHIPKDYDLLMIIQEKVKEELIINPKTFKVKLALKFIFYFIGFAVSYISLFYIHSLTIFLLQYCIYGIITLLFAFNFSHDFSHNTVFENKKLNHYCFIIMYTIVGAHAEAWKQRHINSHHHAPNVEGHDTDLNISNLIRVIPGSPYFWFHRYQHIYAPFIYTTYSIFWVFIKDFVMFFSKEPKTKNTAYLISFWFQKSFYILFIIVLPILFSAQKVHIVLLGFILMHLSQSLFLLFTFFMTHHVEKTQYPTINGKGKINTSWVMNQIISSNDMHPFSEVCNFILGGFNNHIAHHLFPHIHHIHYPKLNLILYKVLKVHSIIPNQTSYWGGALSHLRLLKRMSKRTA